MNKFKTVNTIAVVGGGTSAWITAAMLSHNNPFLKVVIIDKEIGTPIGVGEATLLNFTKTMRLCGFEIEDWFFEIDATLKSAILFKGWGKNQTDVWHPFLFSSIEGYETTQQDLWSKFQEYDYLENGCTYYKTSVEYNRVDTSDLDSYAFHVDAGKLVQFLQKESTKRDNLEFYKSEVVDITRNTETNEITELTLKDGTKIIADLYVDCTGFTQLLALDPDRVDVSGRLFCNTALACQIPYEDEPSEMTPYAQANQVDHGWIWIIPTQKRIGSGLVFNRDITDVEEAKDLFVDYWKGRVDRDKIRVIDWTPFYNRNQWHENVISIGLSSGFIEPLESTGIGLIAAGAEQLHFCIGGKFWSEEYRDKFNTAMNGYFEDAIDFVNLHYHYQNRKSKFWDFVRETNIKSQIQEWYEQELTRTDTAFPLNGRGFMFTSNSWICWLIQLGYPVAMSNDGLDKETAFREFTHYNNFESHRYLKSILHRDFIKELKSRQQNSEISDNPYLKKQEQLKWI